MILSKSASYAVRATLLLAERAGDDPMAVDEIAARLDVPRNYLSKILHVLARAGLLSSTRGPGGGFRLAVPAGDLRVADVAGHFDDLPDATTCLLGRERCSDAEPCRAHARWVGVRAAIVELLSETRLVDLAGEPGGASASGNIGSAITDVAP